MKTTPTTSHLRRGAPRRPHTLHINLLEAKRQGWRRVRDRVVGEAAWRRKVRVGQRRVHILRRPSGTVSSPLCKGLPARKRRLRVVRCKVDVVVKMRPDKSVCVAGEEGAIGFTGRRKKNKKKQ